VGATVAAGVNEIGYLGLGSNVGDRRLNLQATVEMLWTHGVDVLASSSVYETEPVGEVLDQRAFYNAVLRVETGLGPLPLLDACKAVERAFGRAQMGDEGYVRHGPRPIDVDLLLLGEIELVHERLTLPHREVLTRRFVMVPLLELDAELTLPDGTVVARALEALGDGQAVRRAGPPLELKG
jgi:2-amino-4-hydroxy-6-hydroxymethyldihydropteridine diphosphokinase